MSGSGSNSDENLIRGTNFHHHKMGNSGSSSLEEIGGTTLEEIVVTVEPVRAICAISKMAFNANYFRLIRKKQIEQFFGEINLSDSDSEAEWINLMMAKLTTEELADL
ncbi:hypothetical protein Fot_37492 [Forsythia ovata]|uniref:Uncharacterized protein n=1 Tax=Forsythia ovata TaxID=205694 RepID=A0ABD1RZ65_9LAMI